MTLLRKIGAFIDSIVTSFQSIDLPPRLAWWVRFLRMKVFAVLVAIIAFSMSVDRDKVRERLESTFSQDPPMGLGMDIKASDLSLSLLLFRMKAHDVVLRSRPLRPADKPSRFVLDEVKVGIGPIGALLGHPTYDFAINAFEGTMGGKIFVGKTELRYEKLRVEDVKLADIQGLQSAVGGLPLDGTLAGKFDLTAPNLLLGTSDGSLELTLDGAALGDGKAKLVVPGDPFLSAGITVPRIKLGELVVNAVIEKGRARIDAFRAHSADLDLTVEGYIELRDPITISQLHLFLRFKPSDDLLKREPTLGLVTTGLGAGKRGDGFFGAQITGTLGVPRFEPNKSPPAGVVSKFEAGAAGPSTPTVAAPAPAPAAVVAAPAPAPVAAVAAPAPAVVDAATAAPAMPAAVPDSVPDRPVVPNSRFTRPGVQGPSPGAPPPGPPPGEEGGNAGGGGGE